MTTNPETFAKARTLQDSSGHPGDEAAAAGRMRALAQAAASGSGDPSP